MKPWMPGNCPIRSRLVWRTGCTNRSIDSVPGLLLEIQYNLLDKSLSVYYIIDVFNVEIDAHSRCGHMKKLCEKSVLGNAAPHRAFYLMSMIARLSQFTQFRLKFLTPFLHFHNLLGKFITLALEEIDDRIVLFKLNTC